MGLCGSEAGYYLEGQGPVGDIRGLKETLLLLPQSVLFDLFILNWLEKLEGK